MVLILVDPGAVIRDGTRIRTGVKFPLEKRYAGPDSRPVTTDCPWVSEDEWYYDQEIKYFFL